MLQRSKQQLTMLIASLISAMLIVGVFISGCENPEKKEIEKWRRENPFTNMVRPNPDTIIIVTCRLYPLELPRTADITTTAFWKKYGLACPDTPPKNAVANLNQTSNAAPDTNPGVNSNNSAHANNIANSNIHPFTDQQICLWHNNGLEIALAPLSEWGNFQNELLQLQAIQPPGTIHDVLLRNPTQAAEFVAANVNQPTALFAIGTNNILRGSTLENGTCLFKIYCCPVEDTPPINNIYVRITPAFRSYLQTSNIYARQLQGLPPAENVTDFNQLTINCKLPEGYFMCITRRANFNRPGNIGQTFLTYSTDHQDFQLVLLITPDARTARQMQQPNTHPITSIK